MPNKLIEKIINNLYTKDTYNSSLKSNKEDILDELRYNTENITNNIKDKIEESLWTSRSKILRPNRISDIREILERNIIPSEIIDTIIDNLKEKDLNGKYWTLEEVQKGISKEINENKNIITMNRNRLFGNIDKIYESIVSSLQLHRSKESKPKYLECIKLILKQNNVPDQIIAEIINSLWDENLNNRFYDIYDLLNRVSQQVEKNVYRIKEDIDLKLMSDCRLPEESEDYLKNFKDDIKDILKTCFITDEKISEVINCLYIENQKEKIKNKKEVIKIIISQINQGSIPSEIIKTIGKNRTKDTEENCPEVVKWILRENGFSERIVEKITGKLSYEVSDNRFWNTENVAKKISEKIKEKFWDLKYLNKKFEENLNNNWSSYIKPNTKYLKSNINIIMWKLAKEWKITTNNQDLIKKLIINLILLNRYEEYENKMGNIADTSIEISNVLLYPSWDGVYLKDNLDDWIPQPLKEENYIIKTEQKPLNEKNFIKIIDNLINDETIDGIENLEKILSIETIENDIKNYINEKGLNVSIYRKLLINHKFSQYKINLGACIENLDEKIKELTKKYAVKRLSDLKVLGDTSQQDKLKSIIIYIAVKQELEKKMRIEEKYQEYNNVEQGDKNDRELNPNEGVRRNVLTNRWVDKQQGGWQQYINVNKTGMADNN